ncbi:hemolysin family protein [Candidatus Protochlamydia amoebophila]|uniref:hemolysin family protein n=1 Tax=Candidatus Protochlamydia amoebophila TaxID=362787 RepID=UPI001BC9C36A|nr:hemolysin family protein [Candidatus Protochlamydia amoebophila]
MPLNLTLFLLVILIIGLFCLTAINTALRRLHKKNSKKQLSLSGKLFFYRRFHAIFFRNQEAEELFFITTLAQNILRFIYVIFSLTILIQLNLISWLVNPITHSSSLIINWPAGLLCLISLFFLFFTVGDYLARILGGRYPEIAIQVCALVSSLFMALIFPLTFLFLKFSQAFARTIYFNPLSETASKAKQEIIEIIEESNFTASLDPHDKKLIEGVMDFKDRIAREVMVPRVDIFSLAHDTTIEQAAVLIYNEGYSRIPVFKHTLDNIIGVLMYKDVLAKYIEFSRTQDTKILQAPISGLVKNVLYTPETKKISHLLQEFRKKQVHLAIIVDEYGGTEGIVTIEDILEEIVGDIADEYDESEESLFVALPEGGWLIDARMTIFDIEEQFDIEIPQDGDYDTVGGYIFHETGNIPSKGFVLTKPNFELKVIRSNDRRVEKLKIRSIRLDSEEKDEFSS